MSKDGDGTNSVDAKVKRSKHLRHDWLVYRHDYNDGDINIIWGFVYIEVTRFKVGIQSYHLDGLPVRRIALGWVAFGWGETHEWFSCDKP